MFFSSFGIWQILLILLVILILFGVGKLPEVGRGLGKAINEFRTNVRDKDEKESDKNTDEAATESPKSKSKSKK